MTKYVILMSLVLSACSAKQIPPPKSRNFACITALGGANLNTGNPEVKLNRETISLTQEGTTLIINRVMCVEIESN